MSEQAPFVDAARSIDPTNVTNNFISYYTYGQALALGLDLAIRAHYPGKSLDDWMRTMWHEHPDIDKPYTLDDLERSLAETTGDKKFAHEIFTDSIRGLKPLDYGQLAAPAGLMLNLAHPGKAWLGTTRMTASTNGLDLTAPTLRGSPLYAAGVDSGDQIQECDHEAAKTLGKLDSCLAAKKPGDVLTLSIKGRSGVRSVAVTLAQDPALELVTFEHAGKPVTPEIKEFRGHWLSSRATGQKIP
jgi:predicted metalloprotease with PDZ domain